VIHADFEQQLFGKMYNADWILAFSPAGARDEVEMERFVGSLSCAKEESMQPEHAHVNLFREGYRG
jgi:hypothetical protein